MLQFFHRAPPSQLITQKSLHCPMDFPMPRMQYPHETNDINIPMKYPHYMYIYIYKFYLFPHDASPAEISHDINDIYIYIRKTGGFISPW